MVVKIALFAIGRPDWSDFPIHCPGKRMYTFQLILDNYTHKINITFIFTFMLN